MTGKSNFKELNGMGPDGEVKSQPSTSPPAEVREPSVMDRPRESIASTSCRKPNRILIQ
jgi:hypothetical protein